MKTFKTALHFWITVFSLLSFLGGWMMLAHSRKPVQPTQSAAVNIAPLPTLPPIQFFNDVGGNNSSLNSFVPQAQPQQSSGFPLLRTGGS